MQIIFYKTSSPSIATTKTLTGATNKTGTLRDDCDILNPHIEVLYDSSLATYNYAYIAEFGRYYYIGKKTYSNKCLVMEMTVDPLMSWRTALLNSTAKMSRSNIGNLYIPDNLIQLTAQHNIQYRKLSTGFTKAQNYILTLGG